MYTPKPVNTADVKLTDDLLGLVERIAENAHDVWAQGRIKEGWCYGEEKNQEKKTTPCLVSYSELPESEKDYDRKLVTETIKLILKFGYKIEK